MTEPEIEPGWRYEVDGVPHGITEWEYAYWNQYDFDKKAPFTTFPRPGMNPRVEYDEPARTVRLLTK